MYHFKAEMWIYLLLINALSSHCFNHEVNWKILIVYNLPHVSFVFYYKCRKVVTHSQAFWFASACHLHIFKCWKQCQDAFFISIEFSVTKLREKGTDLSCYAPPWCYLLHQRRCKAKRMKGYQNTKDLALPWHSR